MKNRFFILLTALIIISATAFQALAAQSDDEERVYAVQEKVFFKHHELGLNLGYIADDDFFNVFPLGLSYTYNFDENYSWEVIRFQYAFTSEKELKKDLLEDFGAAPTQFTKPRYFFHSSIIFKPLYGKDAVLNRGIINRESYVSLGLGLANYEKQYSSGVSTTENAPSISIGLGTKYFLNEKFCLNLELRDMVNFRKAKTENVIYFGASIGYRFNFSPRKSAKDETLKKLDHYLRK